MRSALLSFALLAALSLAPTAASAQGTLHGYGPINSSMGGAGVALPEDSLNAVGFNPALVTAVEGTQLSFATEFQKDSIQVATTVGSASGNQTGTNYINFIPSFGWMSRDPRKNMALGFGLVSLGGFSTDYAANPSSILFGNPPNALGRVYSSYSLTKVPVAAGFQVNPKLSIGVSANIYIAQFSIAPLTSVVDVASNGTRWYPEAGRPSQRLTVAPQFGFFYQASPMMSVGGSVTLKQAYPSFEFVSTDADPTSRTFGATRTLNYDLDGPMVATFGVGLHPDKATAIAIDGMYTRYTGVAGFDNAGGYAANGTMAPLAWQDTFSFKVGVRRDVNEKAQVRVGYNFTQTPLKTDAMLSNINSPIAFQHHLSAGMGMKLFPFLTAEASFYVAPRGHVTGSYPSAKNVNQGSIDLSNALTAALVGFNFRF